MGARPGRPPAGERVAMALPVRGVGRASEAIARSRRGPSCGDDIDERHVEREEPHPGPPGSVDDVRANVHLHEPTVVWQRRQRGGAKVLHHEGDETDPGAAVEGVHGNSSREELLHLGWSIPPVQERDVGPALRHERRAGEPWRPVAHASTPRSAARAAWYPHIPCTPPPGGVEAEQRKRRGFAVRWG